MKTAIIELFKHYHEKVKTQPKLYATLDNAVHVILPEELHEFANAAAGNHIIGGVKKPQGIRQYSDNPAVEIKRIFASVESLTIFIQSSECDWYAHQEWIKVNGPAARSKKAQKPVMPKEGFWRKYDKSTMELIKSKFKKKLLRQAWDTMTWAEFEEKFVLTVL